MSRAASTVLSVLMLLGVAMPVAAEERKPDDAPAGVVPGEVVVGWRDAGRGPQVARARGLAIVAALDPGTKGTPAASVVSTNGRPVDAVIAELKSDAAVAYAEPNYLFSLPENEVGGTDEQVDAGGGGTITGIPVDDPKTGGQYSLDRMRVRDAWWRSTGGSNLIAVLDTGVQSSHPDLEGRVVRGYDFVNDDTSASDDNGHGTWVAGIIAANANDGYGIAGISWSDKILPVKIMNSSGTGSTSDLATAIVYAANKGADVINMSVGGFPYSQAVLDAVNYAWDSGAVLVGAAGNNHRREDYYPASYDRVISVSATQVEDEFSHWSSYGPKVDVSAPGSSVQTTNCTSSGCPNRGWGPHTYISGTSFAAPNVAGVVALLLDRYPTYTPYGIVNRLYNTVDDLGYAGRDDRYGRGRVNAHRALGAAVAQPGRVAGDGMEGNDTESAPKSIPMGSATTPSIYPAGDVDWFSVTIPRAGRLEVRVNGVVDVRDYPWNRSTLPIDPILELYTTGGNLITRVDREWETGTELATYAADGRTRILVRVSNYYPNGNRLPYSVTPSFVDTVAPAVTAIAPVGGSDEVSQWVLPVARFSEQVSNVSATTVRLRDMATNALVPVDVSYSTSEREVLLSPHAPLVGSREYRFELGSGIEDAGGNNLATTRTTFRTSDYTYRDIQGTPFAVEIEWMSDEEITRGCSADRFCPTRELNRGEMASFLARALDLPAATMDHFTDDDGASHEDAINRLAEAKITFGCGGTRYCPRGVVNRGQMASFLSRALELPGTSNDYFGDDDGISHEDNINRLAAAALTAGCGTDTFCPREAVNRQQVAAFLYRALH